MVPVRTQEEVSDSLAEGLYGLSLETAGGIVAYGSRDRVEDAAMRVNAACNVTTGEDDLPAMAVPLDETTTADFLSSVDQSEIVLVGGLYMIQPLRPVHVHDEALEAAGK